MLKIILGVIVGFVAWSIVWVGSDQALISFSPDWYGAHQYAFQAAIVNGTAFVPESTILLMHLFRAGVVSIMAGFIAAVVAGENRRAPLVLGFVLLLIGAAVEAAAWNYLPIWYHLVFLVLLVPMTMLGGKMKQSA